MSDSSVIPPAFSSTARTGGLLARIAPGLPALLNYRFAEDFRHDLIAGLSSHVQIGGPTAAFILLYDRACQKEDQLGGNGWR